MFISIVIILYFIAFGTFFYLYLTVFELNVCNLETVTSRTVEVKQLGGWGRGLSVYPPLFQNLIMYDSLDLGEAAKKNY